MNSKHLVVGIALALGIVVVSTGSLAFPSIISSTKPVPWGGIYPTDPAISENQSEVQLSIELGVQGEPAIPIKNVTVYALDENCDVVATIPFGAIQGIQKRHAKETDLRKTATTQTVPQYFVPDVPDQPQTDRGRVVIHGLRRSSDTPTNGSYEWTAYEIEAHDDRSTWCDSGTSFPLSIGEDVLAHLSAVNSKYLIVGIVLLLGIIAGAGGLYYRSTSTSTDNGQN